MAKAKKRKAGDLKYDEEEIHIVIQDDHHINSYDHVEDAEDFIESAEAAACSCTEPFAILRSSIEKAAPKLINESVDFLQAFDKFVEKTTGKEMLSASPEVKALVAACVKFKTETHAALALATGDGHSKDVLKYFREKE